MQVASDKQQAVYELLKERRDAETATDVDSLREDWIQDLSDLFERLRSWMTDAEKQGLLKVEQDEVELKEERLGRYQAPMLRVITPGVSVRIVPRGRLIIGAQGRVDFETPASRILLVRTKQSSWEFRELAECRWRGDPLTEQSFWAVLDSLLR